MSCNIGFTGNKYLLEKIQKLLKQDFNYDLKLNDYSTYSRIYITNSNVGKLLCQEMYKNFFFPYGHSKTVRYFEAFGLKIPYKCDECKSRDFNVIIPQYEIDGGINGLSGKQLWIWGNAMLNAEIIYKNMIELGATPQIARSVLPNSTKTEITITANYREWRNFFKLRTAKAAHPSMREITIPLLKELKTKLPVIFDGIEVED